MFPKNVKEQYSILTKGECDIFFHLTRYISSFECIKSYNVNGYITDTKINENENNEKSEIEFNLLYKAPYGDYMIPYKETEIHIIYDYNNTIVGTRQVPKYLEFINISNDSKNILEDFVEDARLFCKKPEKPPVKSNFTKIYQFDTGKGRWSLLSKLKKRDLDSIYLNENEVNTIEQDIDKFIDSEETYEKFGIPYKRNYLFYGIPGTGKTSLLFSLASKYNMSLAIVNFGPVIDDSLFMNIVHSMPENSLFILEDIDGLFIDRSQGSSNKSMVSFSGILNTLDGVGRKNKLITFMTTNHTDRLDPAILRPGRVDYKIEFTYATTHQISQMYDVFIGKSEYKKQFMKSVKSLQLTTCMLQKFLFDNRDIDNINTKIEELEESCNFYKTNNKTMYT
jgi:hypothetical protein